jgi:hypothetical protein
MSVAAEPAAAWTAQAAGEPRPTSIVATVAEGQRTVMLATTADPLEIPGFLKRQKTPVQVTVAAIAEGNHIIPCEAAAIPAPAS